MIISITKGEKIRVSNNKLIIENSEEKNEISLKDIRLIVIENIYSSITIKTLLKLNENKVFILICNKKYQPQLQVLDLYSNYKVTERLQEQIKWSLKRKNKCFKKIVERKLLHQKEFLEVLDKKEGIKYLENLIKNIKMLKEVKVSEIQSMEGVGARVYFRELFSSTFKRFNNDIVNSGLNYGYAIIRSLIMKIIVEKGFHPSLGIEHHSVYNNYNLADDIIEIFRPMIDYVVYFNYEEYAELDKEFRHKLLKVLFQEVIFNGKSYKLEYVIERYIESLAYYLNGSKNNIAFPKLVIENYEY